MARRRPLSVRARLLLCLIGGNLVLVGAFALCTIMYIRRELLQAFDESLKANAEAVRALVDVDDRDMPEGMTVPAEVMSRFRRSRHPDLFAVLYPDGRILAKSEQLDTLPSFVRAVENPRVREFEFEGETYRGMVLPLELPHTPATGDADDVEIIGFFASTREDLDEEIRDSQEFVLVAGSGVMLLSVLTAWLVARASLRPFVRIAAETSAIDERTLHRRFDTDMLPRDLVPFGLALNSLLHRLQGAFEREKRFSADAAHELRTPVASLKAGIQAAQLFPRDPREDARLLAELLDDVARLEELCESLLATAVAEGATEPGNVRLPAGELDGLLRSLVAGHAQAAAAAGHRIGVEIPGDLATRPDLRTDSFAVSRVVGNLLGNALRHGDREGLAITLRVEPARVGGGLDVIVEDDGTGVPEELRERIFERFFRREDSRNRAGGGAGLGLAICRKLAQRDGGMIVCEAAASGGALFRWTIAAVEQLERES